MIIAVFYIHIILYPAVGTIHKYIKYHWYGIWYTYIHAHVHIYSEFKLYIAPNSLVCTLFT